MEIFIAAIVQKFQSLPEVEILEVLNFVESLTWNKERLTFPPLEEDAIREDEEFKAIADQIADEFKMYVGNTMPVLSDYAGSRVSIYDEQVS